MSPAAAAGTLLRRCHCCCRAAAIATWQVNEVWAGLGYYRRARYLLEGAQYIMDKLDGTFPETAAGVSFQLLKTEVEALG